MKCGKPPATCWHHEAVPRRHRIAHSLMRFNLHHSTEAVQRGTGKA